jgi:hypothetical protein
MNPKINFGEGIPLKWLPAPIQKGKFDLISEQKEGRKLKQILYGNFEWTHLPDFAAKALILDQKYTINRGLYAKSLFMVQESGKGKIGITKLRYISSGEGLVIFYDNEKYKWVLKNIPESHWTFLNENGDPVINFQGDSPIRKGLEVFITGEYANHKYINILLTLGLYTLLMAD